MRTTAPPARVSAALVAVGIAAAALTGCSSGPIQDLVGQQVEEAVEQTTGGEVSFGGELPTGFPASIPLIDGELTFSAGSGGAEGWIVTIDPSVGDAIGAAGAALEAGGFVLEPAFEGIELGAEIFTDGTHLVLLSGDDQAVMYTVTPVAQ